MSENVLVQTADRVRELTAALNAEIGKAADLGLRVEVDVNEPHFVGTRWPEPRLEVTVTREVESGPWP